MEASNDFACKSSSPCLCSIGTYSNWTDYKWSQPRILILKNGSSAWNHSCTYGKNCIKINLKDFYVMLLKLYELFWEEIDKFPVKGSTSSKYHWVYQESWKWKKRERCHSVSKLYQELWIQSKERKYWHRLDKFINISMHHVQEGSTCKHSKNWWSKKQPFQSSYCPHLK